MDLFCASLLSIQSPSPQSSFLVDFFFLPKRLRSCLFLAGASFFFFPWAILYLVVSFGARDDFLFWKYLWIYPLSFPSLPAPFDPRCSTLRLSWIVDYSPVSCVPSSPTDFSRTLETVPYDCSYRIIHEMLRVLKGSTKRVFCCFWKARAGR